MIIVTIRCIPQVSQDIDENGNPIQVTVMVPEVPIDQARLASMTCDGEYYTVAYISN